MPDLVITSALTLFMAAMPVLACGCLDVVVVHVDEPSSDGGGPMRDPDGSADAASNRCEECLRADPEPGPGCGHRIADCATHPQCANTFDCVLPLGCFELTGQGNIVDCGTDCARAAGLETAGPAAPLIYAVVTCAQDVCGPICRGEESPRADGSVRREARR